MPVPEHVKIVFRGEFQGTAEEWSFGMKFSQGDLAGPGDGGFDPNSAVNDTDVEAALNVFLHTSLFASQIRCLEYRAYSIGTTGRMQGEPHQHIFASPIAGTGGNLWQYPIDSAVCVTTVGASRGPGRFGRFYLPQTQQTLGADGRLSVAQAGVVLAAAVTFAKSISDAIDLPLTESSEMLNISTLGGGARQTVDHFRVGRVPDRIERRRRQLVEDYQDSGQIDW